MHVILFKKIIHIGNPINVRIRIKFFIIVVMIDEIGQLHVVWYWDCKVQLLGKWATVVYGVLVGCESIYEECHKCQIRVVISIH